MPVTALKHTEFKETDTETEKNINYAFLIGLVIPVQYPTYWSSK